MLCPICKKVNLDRAIVSGVEVSYCPQCLGLWFEEEELRFAKDYQDRSLRWLDIDLWEKDKKFKISSGKKLCPKDRLPLYQVDYGDSKIYLEVCNLCQGIWLDRGEFKKIIEYLRKTADQEILNDYLKNLRKEFWEIFSGPETLKEEIEDFIIVLKLLKYKFLVQYQTISKIIASLPR